MRVENVTDKITLYNCDCMEYMKNIPDKYFDLAICDPPYGIERFKKGSLRIDKSEKSKSGLVWDNVPDKKYFKELFRVSKNQIIWGANNFEGLPKTEYFIVWNKEQTVENFASAEYAWTNCKMPAKVFTYSIHKTMADRKEAGGKIHPTQKPIKLYEWLLKNYAKPTDKIIDTHFGSCSIGIACHNFGCSLDACEIDDEYFDKAYKRLRMQVRQLDLFK